MKKFHFLKVPLKEGEQTRKKLIDDGVMDRSVMVFNQDGFIFIPIDNEKINSSEKNSKYLNYQVIEKEEQEISKKINEPKNLQDALESILTNDEALNLTKSFEIIGDLAIMEIPTALQPKEKEIGQALLKIHKNIKGVFKKLGPMEGEYRVRQLKHIAGEKRTETIHKENGVLIKLDIEAVYFSARLSTERKRISDLVVADEKILIFFAGVGPYAMVIGKQHKNAEVLAIELNPMAVRYLEENILLNKLNNITAVEADVEKFIMENITKYGNFADRTVMPLPKTAHNFLGSAHKATKNNGIVHFYTIVGTDSPLENAKKHINSNEFEIINWRAVKPYSAELVQIVVDLKVKK